VGADTLTAAYSGDTNYLAGTEAETVMVTAAPGLTLTGSAVTLAPGDTTVNTSTITVTPSNGFTGSVVLTAALTTSPAGAQDPPTFSFGTTSPVNITGTSAGTATLTINTTAASSAALNRPVRPGLRWYEGGAALACLLLFGIPARRRSWRSILGMLVFMAFLVGGATSCGRSNSGGSGSSPLPPPPGSSGTTSGTYVITVTATSGTVTSTGTVSLTVQ
jgi:hypothetical protein